MMAKDFWQQVYISHHVPAMRLSCPSRIRCQAATGSWTKSRQWETERTLFSSARATHVSAGEGQQRVVLQRRVAAYLVVGGQTPGATQRCLNPGYSERIGNSRRTGPGWPRSAARRTARPATGSRRLSRRGRRRSACVVNGRLGQKGEGAVRPAPPCVLCRV